MSRATRREAFAALGATALVGIAGASFARPEAISEPTAAPAPDLDGDLFVACDAFIEADRQLSELVRHHGDQFGSDLPDEAFEEQGRACDVIEKCGGVVTALPARTIAGLRKKAQVFSIAEGWLEGREPDDLLHSLLRDIRSRSLA